MLRNDDSAEQVKAVRAFSSVRRWDGGDISAEGVELIDDTLVTSCEKVET